MWPGLALLVLAVLSPIAFRALGAKRRSSAMGNPSATTAQPVQEPAKVESIAVGR